MSATPAKVTIVTDAKVMAKVVLCYGRSLLRYFLSLLSRQHPSHSGSAYIVLSIPPPHHMLSTSPVVAVTASCRRKAMTATMGLGSDGPIFDRIMTPQYRGRGLSGDSKRTEAMSHYISTLLNMSHKLMYTKFGVLGWCRCHTKKKIPVQLIRK